MYVFVKDPLSNRYVKEQAPGVRPAGFFAFNEGSTIVPSIVETVQIGETLAAEPVAQHRSGLAALLPTWFASRFL
jgi:hypothetical protein